MAGFESVSQRRRKEPGNAYGEPPFPRVPSDPYMAAGFLPDSLHFLRPPSSQHISPRADGAKCATSRLDTNGDYRDTR